MTRSVSSVSFIEPPQHLISEETNKEESCIPENFSDELMCHVFSNFALDSREMDSVARVCTEWKAVSSDQYIAALQLASYDSLNYKQIQNWQQLFKNRYGRDINISEVIKKCPNLKSLDLSGAPINDKDLLDISNAQLHLEELTLSKCMFLIEPDFNGFSRLKILVLSSCSKLIDPKFHNLRFLKKLDLSDCYNLAATGFERLKSLEELDLTRCAYLKNLVVKDLKFLRKLSMRNCISCKHLNFYGLTSLTELDAGHCALESLDLRWSPFLKIFKIDNCCNLKDLNLDGLNSIETICLNSRDLMNHSSLRRFYDNISFISQVMLGE
ncbi:MAG TPA: hypothetical protein VLG49_08360 [Rhabdochlamydiaceae bacterium]|nr:hypothetical protein [Rhabdochlamydiaceae bacterium]